jgi:ABC-type amino acid transport system permease subunit
MAAATIGALLEGPPQRAFLAVAEARAGRARPAVRGFTTLSASLGGMVLALHAALLQAVATESSAHALAVVLRSLCTVVSATPYERLPGSLLVEVLQVGRRGRRQGARHAVACALNAACVRATCVDAAT